MSRARNAVAGLSVRIQPGEATRLLRDLLDDLRQRHGERFVFAADREVHGYWDCERLKQAVQNLVENALKYGRDDGRSRCRSKRSRNASILSVHNEGDPIPSEILPELFKPFRRAPSVESSTEPGWGLGLVMVEAIAEVARRQRRRGELAEARHHVHHRYPAGPARMAAGPRAPLNPAAAPPSAVTSAACRA